MNGVDWIFRCEELWRRIVLLWVWFRNFCELVWVIVFGLGLFLGRNMLLFFIMFCRLVLWKFLKNIFFWFDMFLFSIFKNFICVLWLILFYWSLKRFLIVSFLDDFVIKYDIILRIDLYNLFFFYFEFFFILSIVNVNFYI